MSSLAPPVPAPPVRHYRDSDLPALLDLMGRMTPSGNTPGEKEFREAFNDPKHGRNPCRDLLVKAHPGGGVDGFVALYREDEFFTALGPFLAPDLSVRHRPCAHALLRSAEHLAAERGWRSLRFEVDGSDHERRIVLHNRGYREVRIYRRMELSDLSAGLALTDADLVRGAEDADSKVETLASYADRKTFSPAATLGALLDEALGGTWMFRPHGERGATDRLARHGAGAERVLVAVDAKSDEAVGFIEWSLRPGNEAFLDDIGVREIARRQGWGRRLMKAGLSAMSTEGARRVRLDVDNENRPARWLYRRFGFHDVGTVRYLALRLD
ncbi:MAG: hypothetical protein CME06_03225 [Gemmatimonadetes bacterium]|nr:hypothetical protein [Gemmatimonadota bacterium]